MRQFFFILILFSLTVGRLNRLFYKKNHYFNLNHIQIDWNKNKTFSSPLSQKACNVLNQPYTFLAKGTEFFVFLSKDGKWVLKFPQLQRKRSHKGPPNRLLNIMFLCSTKLSRETKILYAHLEKTNTELTIDLIDSLGHHHKTSLDHSPFFIQKAGNLFFDVFDQTNNPKFMITSAVDVYRSLKEKGYSDRDPLFEKNFGWSDNAAFIFDIGQIYPINRPESLESQTFSLRENLAKKRPDLLPFYQNCLN